MILCHLDAPQILHDALSNVWSSIEFVYVGLRSCYCFICYYGSIYIVVLLLMCACQDWITWWFLFFWYHFCSFLETNHTSKYFKYLLICGLWHIVTDAILSYLLFVWCYSQQHWCLLVCCLKDLHIHKRCNSFWYRSSLLLFSFSRLSFLLHQWACYEKISRKMILWNVFFQFLSTLPAGQLCYLSEAFLLL